MSRQSAGAVIVGAGPAGATATGTLRSGGYDGPLTVIGAEPAAPYNRTTVNKAMLQGLLTERDVVLPEAAAPGAEWVHADPAVHLDVERRALPLASGRSLTYDRLIIAAGARPRE